MKITEILVESKQLDEGPLLNKIGSAVGKGVGTVAKGIGAAAGGVVGAGKAIAKGYQAGKATVAGGGDDEPGAATKTKAAPAAPQAAAGGTPAAQGYEAPANAPQAAAPAAGAAPSNAPAGAAPAGGTPPTASAINKAGPKGTAVAKTQTGKAGQALAKTTQAVAGQDQSQAGQTMYAQVKANIDKLDKKGKQRILQLLQKSITAAPAAEPAAGAGAIGGMAKQLGASGAATPNTMANAPVSKTNVAKPGNPNAKPSGNFDGNTGLPISDAGRAQVQSAADFKASPQGKAIQAKQDAWDQEDKAAAAGGVAPAAEVPAKKTRAASRVPKKAAPSQAEIDADREKIMGPTSDSIIRTAKPISEGFSLYRKR